MVDWLNFWMFLLFIVIGIALLKKLNNDLKFSCLVFQFVACVSFVVAAFSVVPSWNVSFDSALHECTEWKCPDWDGSIGKLNYGEAGNPVCKYEWANGEGERSFVGKTNNTITCISFREKTIEELDADFCKENPTDTTRCYCVEIKNSTLRKGTDLMERDFFNSESELQALLVKHGDRVEGGCIFTSEENFGCSTFDVLNKYLKGKVVKGSVDYRGYREFNFSVCVRAVPKVVV